MSEHITGHCPHCKSAYRLRAHAAGRRARCKTCQQVFVVPGEPVGGSLEDSVASWLNKPEDADGGGGGGDGGEEEVEADFEEEEDEEMPPPPDAGATSQSLDARPQVT